MDPSSSRGFLPGVGWPPGAQQGLQPPGAPQGPQMQAQQTEYVQRLVRKWTSAITSNWNDQREAKAQRMIQQLSMHRDRDRVMRVCYIVDEAIAGIEAAGRGDVQKVLCVLTFLQPDSYVFYVYCRMLRSVLPEQQAQQILLQHASQSFLNDLL